MYSGERLRWCSVWMMVLGRLVVLVRLDDRQAVLGRVEHAGLQRLVDLAEVHRRRDRAEGVPDLRPRPGCSGRGSSRPSGRRGWPPSPCGCRCCARRPRRSRSRLMPRFLLATISSMRLANFGSLTTRSKCGEVLEQVGDAEQPQLRHERSRRCGALAQITSIEPRRTPSTIATSEPSCAAGKTSTLMRPLRPLLDQLPEHLVAFVVHAADRLVVAHPQRDLLCGRAPGGQRERRRRNDCGKALHEIPPQGEFSSVIEPEPTAAVSYAMSGRRGTPDSRRPRGTGARRGARFRSRRRRPRCAAGNPEGAGGRPVTASAPTSAR